MGEPERRVVVPAHHVAAGLGVVLRGSRIPRVFRPHADLRAEAADGGTARRFARDQRANLLQQMLAAAVIPRGPIVEHPVTGDVWAGRVAIEQLRNPCERNYLRRDARILVRPAIVVVRIARRWQCDGVRAMALPVKDDRRNAAVDNADMVLLQRYLE